MTDLIVRNDEYATKRIENARAELILSRRFYGVLVSNVVPKLSRKFPTMATDSKTHYYNPDFINKLPKQKHVLTVQAHESEHDARHHSTRRGSRDPKKWNIACDHTINVDLVDQGFEFPPENVIKVYCDFKYRGMSAEDIYRCMELDEQAEQKKQQEKEKEQDEESEESEAESQEGDEGEGAQDSPPENDEDSPEGGEDGEAGEAEGDEAEAETDAEGGNGSSDSDGDEESSGSQSDESGDEPGSDSGTGAGNDDDASDPDSESEDVTGSGEGDADGEQSSSGDPGGMGEVIDAAEDPGELADEDGRWDRIVRQAASLSKGIGQLPGHVSRDIERANNPKQDWREVLRAWIDSTSKRVETWNKPNRRHMGRNYILPGSEKDGLNTVIFLVDTSGSMDDIALACANVEMQDALDNGAIDRLIVVYGDTRVTRIDEYVEGDQIEFDPRGGGGTDLKPLFAWVKDNVDDASLIIAFTDLEIGDAGEQPNCPVLWAVTGYPQTVERYLENTPWGEPGIDIGAH
jgi:predicted metal-dependent peptidase